jgi:hypothetical protein
MVSGGIIDGVGVHHRWYRGSSSMVSGFIIDGVGVHHRWCRGSSSMVSGFIIDGIGLHHRWCRGSSSMVSGFIIDGIGVVLERCQSTGNRVYAEALCAAPRIALHGSGGLSRRSDEAQRSGWNTWDATRLGKLEILRRPPASSPPATRLRQPQDDKPLSKATKSRYCRR